jgi:3-deoxy-7-phosphoheptulonate synthase
VLLDVAGQLHSTDDVLGVMLESHLVAGQQLLRTGVPLTHGQSITDACIDLGTTVSLLEELALAVHKRRARNAHTSPAVAEVAQR